MGGASSDLNALANVATVAIPLSFAYAIVKHRVFDITVVIRRGLQYLLAKNALRGLLLLPAAGLAYGLIVHDQPIAKCCAPIRFTSTSFRGDRRPDLLRAALTLARSAVFSRGLRPGADPAQPIQDVEKLESASSVSKLVTHELESAFHPTCLFVWYREADKPNLSLSYSSGGYLHSVELGPTSPFVRLAEREGAVVSRRWRAPTTCPPTIVRGWTKRASVSSSRLRAPIAACCL